ncbi:transporter substrate-binding domain-containing protein [Vibrio sp.]|nr:transporter substrate-binding domain-containing protein [Vibrio sp.]
MMFKKRVSRQLMPSGKKRFFNKIELSLFVATLFAMPAMAEEAQTDPSASPEVVRIAIEGAYPPFSWVASNGELTGFDVEVMTAICDQMKATCEFTTQEWDGLIPSLLEGKYDAFIAGMSVTEKRQKKIDFTLPYASIPARYIAKKTTDINMDDLSSLRIGVRVNTIHDNYLTDNYPNHKNIRRYPHYDDAYFNLVNDDIDILLGDASALYDSIISQRGGEEYHFVGPQLNDKQWFGEGLGIGINKTDTSLKSQLNHAIVKVVSSDEYEQIHARYFSLDH